MYPCSILFLNFELSSDIFFFCFGSKTLVINSFFSSSNTYFFVNPLKVLAPFLIGLPLSGFLTFCESGTGGALPLGLPTGLVAFLSPVNLLSMTNLIPSLFSLHPFFIHLLYCIPSKSTLLPSGFFTCLLL